MSIRAVPLTGVAAGVPFLAVPPDTGPRACAPVVVAWHLMDPPRTEAAFAAALPLAGLDAWRLYLGLPLCGSRLPAGGFEELERLGYEDAVLKLTGPVTAQAAQEFGAVLAELRTRLDLGNGPLGLVGGSVGAAVVQLVLAEQDVGVDAAVLVSPLVQLRPAVDALARQYGFAYSWSEASLAVAQRLDFVARAEEIARYGEPAVLLVVGEDDLDGFREPAARLRDALAGRYADAARAQLETVAGLAHALAEEPGLDRAPQTASAATVDRHAVRWLQRHLTEQSAECGFLPATARPGQHLHDDGFGDGEHAVGGDQGGQPLIHRAAGGPVVLHPGGSVGQDHAAPCGATSAGGSSIANAPRIARASSRVIGWPARCRSARSTASVLVRTPYRSMIAWT